MTKTLVVYYSRTGTTRKVAKALVEKYDADVEEIKDLANRNGILGYLRAGRDAMRKKLTKIEKLKYDPTDYDLVVVGTPIWGWNVSVPVRTYLTENKDKFKKISFFCTMGGSGDKQAFAEMEEIVGKRPEKTWTILTRGVMEGKLENLQL